MIALRKIFGIQFCSVLAFASLASATAPTGTGGDNEFSLEANCAAPNGTRITFYLNRPRKGALLIYTSSNGTIGNFAHVQRFVDPATGAQPGQTDAALDLRVPGGSHLAYYPVSRTLNVLSNPVLSFNCSR